MSTTSEESWMLAERKLGQTGLTVTQLGYGSMGLRGQKRGVFEWSRKRPLIALNLILDAGINFIDTSPDYGICEERIGRYLSNRRDEFILATKCGCVYTQHEDRGSIIIGIAK